MIAMSGGVDSSVAAALTAQARGRDTCAGVAMRLYSTAEDALRSGRTCCAPDDLYDARRAAAAIGIRFYVYDAQERFRARVIEPFIEAYDPRLLNELRLFVRAFAMDLCWEGDAKVFYSSLRWQPGLVQMAPYLLGKREGMKLETRGDPLLAMLVAAQIIHEGLHQKHFYLNSCEDPSPIDEGLRGFTRPEFSEVPITCTWGERRGLSDLLNLAVSVGYEIRFLEYLARTQNLRADAQDFFERRLKRKRGYLLPLVVQGELWRHGFSAEVQTGLEELFRLCGYRTT